MTDRSIEQYSRDGNYTEPRTHADYDEIVSDDLSLPVSTVNGTDLSRFEGKVTFGAYNKDSDTVQSAWIQTVWTGGALINKHSEGATDQRFRSAVAWTMNTEQLALPPRLDTFNVQRSSFLYGGSYDLKPDTWHLSMPLAEFNNGFYYALGRTIYKVTTRAHHYTEGFTNTSIASLAAPPIAPGAVYGPVLTDTSSPDRRPRLFIPLGNEGVQVIREDHFIPAADLTVKALSLRVWDRRLFALTADGYLRYYIQDDGTPAGVWDNPSTDRKLPNDQVPRGLTTFYDRGGNSTIFIATDKQLWAYDPENDRIAPTSLILPKHPDNGWGFSDWRDDAVYYATGSGISRYSRDAVLTDMGLDRDDGIDVTTLLPAFPPNPAFGLQGRYDTQYGQFMDPPSRPLITSLTKTRNFLVALVAKGATYNAGTNAYTSRFTVDVWNEAGWHTIQFVQVTTVDCFVTPSQAVLTEVTGGYRLWFGLLKWGGSNAVFETVPGLFSIGIPRNAHGPRQQVSLNIGAFANAGSFYSGWFDAGMEGFDKLFSHFEMVLSRPPDNRALLGYVDVRYRTNLDPNTWVTLGRVQQYGRTVLKFGVDSTGFSRGMTAQSIELAYFLHTDDITQSPIIETTILKFIKIPLPGRSFLLGVPLDVPNFKGTGPEEIDDYLSRKTYESGFVKMIHKGKSYRVRYAQHQFVEGTGDNPFKNTTVNIIEVPVSESDPA